jgi:hypothetical protein
MLSGSKINPFDEQRAKSYFLFQKIKQNNFRRSLIIDIDIDINIAIRVCFVFSYQNNNEIQAMISLVDAYQHHEIRTFEDVQHY